MWDNTDQNTSEYGHFLRSVCNLQLQFYTCLNEISDESRITQVKSHKSFVHARTHTHTHTHIERDKSYELKEFLTAQDNEIVFMYILIHVAMKTYLDTINMHIKL